MSAYLPDALPEGFWGTGPFWFWMFWLSLFFNARAVFKLLIDWKGMRTTLGFVERAYAAVDALPDEATLERAADRPTFVHLVPALHEPDVTKVLAALLASRYPHGGLHVIVACREEEERSPHPAMVASTAELVRRFRDGLPPWQRKMLSLVIAPPSDRRKAHQLNWAVRPDVLRGILGEGYDPSRVYIGLSDADSVPDPNVYRWIAAEVLGGRARLGYQGVTLSVANFERLDFRGRVCAIQQSSIFTRVSIARLINEVKRIALFRRLDERAPWLGALARPVFEFCFRRSQIFLGHNQFVRLDVLMDVGGFPEAGATEDSTLGYALGSRGILIGAMPMLETVELPETREKLLRQNARWYKGVLDDVAFLWDVWRRRPTPFNTAQLLRHVGNKVVEWPIAALIYPVIGFLGWHLAYRFNDSLLMFAIGIGAPTCSLALTIVVGGIVTQQLVERLMVYCPRRVNVARTSLQAKFWGIFRCQTYWLLATRGAWRVLASLIRKGRFEAAKTDRVTRPVTVGRPAVSR